MPYPKNIQELLGDAISLGEVAEIQKREGALFEDQGTGKIIPGSGFTWDMLRIDTQIGQIDVWVRSEVVRELQERIPART